MSQLFNPEGFFSFASSVVRDPNASEAGLRSAVSRAYYAVFITARDRLFGDDQKNLNNKVKKKIRQSYRQQTGNKKPYLGNHELVIFTISDRAKDVMLSTQLDQLREARVAADYKRDYYHLSKVGKQSWREYAEETMELAALILPLAKKLSSY